MMRILVAVALLSAALPSLAQDDDEDKARQTSATAEDFQRVEERAPRLGTPLIANKLYPMSLRFEITGIFDYSFNDKYVQHTGGSGALVFHIFDFLAIEGFGGYLVGDETGIVSNVRLDGSSAKKLLEGNEENCFSATCEPQLPDMWMTTWFAGADVQWSPIYGKISAFSEYDLNFQLYALAGAGAEGIARHRNDDPNALDTPAAPRISANYGLGVRLMPIKWVALRAELRNYNGLNPNVEEHQTADEDACSGGYTLRVGAQEQCFPDISNNTMLQIGLSLIL